MNGHVRYPQLRSAVFAVDGPFLTDGFFADRALADKLRAAVFTEPAFPVGGCIGTFGANEAAFHNKKLIIQNQDNRTFYFWDGRVKEERLPLKGMVYASMFGAMTAVGALISIPLQPVPITLQTFFLYLAAALLGGTLGALSQIVYVLLGVLMGPTGGYLTGFIFAAFVIGKLVETRKNAGFPWLVLSMLAGGIILYTLGVLQLMVVADLSPAKAVAAGVLPFAPGDILKIVAAAAMAIKIRGRINI